MKIKYLGHSAFELTLEDGRRIVTDPYESGSYGGALAYGPITGTYDYAIVSHGHQDHNCTDVTSRVQEVLEEEGEFDLGGIRVKTIPTFHDTSKGSERGGNLISIIETEGIRIAHLGDLGHPLSPADVPELEGVDVLLVPVGGHFTIDAPTAAGLAEAFKPGIVIPMHFKTDKVDFPIRPVDDFIELVDDAERNGGSEIEITKKTLSGTGKVIVLEPAL